MSPPSRRVRHAQRRAPKPDSAPPGARRTLASSSRSRSRDARDHGVSATANRRSAIADQTTVRPPCTERDSDRSPSLSVVATRRRARSHQKPALHREPVRVPDARPTPVCVLPASWVATSESVLSGELLSSGNRISQVTRKLRATGHADVAIVVVPAGQPASQPRRPRSARTVPGGGCPRARRMDTRPRPAPLSGPDPALRRPSEATTRRTEQARVPPSR